MERSKGHICFSRLLDGSIVEYHEVAGEVYRSPLSNVFDLDTGSRLGRWECSRSHFEQYRHLILGVTAQDSLPM